MKLHVKFDLEASLNNIKPTSDFNDLFYLLDGEIGIITNQRKIFYEDKLLQALYVLKISIIKNLFSSPNLPVEVPSIYNTSDYIELTAIDCHNCVGKISTYREEFQFELQSASFYRDIGESLLIADKILLHKNVYDESSDIRTLLLAGLIE